MCACQGGPVLVTRLLVCCLDSQNVKSYVSGSNVVVDASQNGNNFTLTGALQWTATGGWWQFTSTAYLEPPNTGAFAALKTGNGGNGYTTMAWASAGLAGGWSKLLGQADASNYIDLWSSSATPARYWQEDGSNIQVNAEPVAQDSYTLGAVGWRMLTSTNVSSGSVIVPNTPFRIGADSSNSAYIWRGNINMVAVYSGVLTPAELLQNFNSFRGRYGQ